MDKTPSQHSHEVWVVKDEVEELEKFEKFVKVRPKQPLNLVRGCAACFLGPREEKPCRNLGDVHTGSGCDVRGGNQLFVLETETTAVAS